MQPAKVKILVCLFAYSGNGGIPGTIPEIALWLAKTYYLMRTDPRIEAVGLISLCDTPITMTRNKAVKIAQDGGFDMVLMLDSDNEPDGYVGADPSAKPFWQTAFDFAYDRLIRGLPTAIAAPYSGPPPHPVKGGDEVPYLLEWENTESDVRRPGVKLRLLNRNEAFRMKGIHSVAALPTGVCLFTVNCFEGMKKPYFNYDFSPDGSEKQSTEDIFCTRNISLHWAHKIGENVVFAACDSWALHHKVKKVGRPTMTTVEQIADDFKQSVLGGVTATETLREIDFTKRMGDGITEGEAEAIVQEVHRQTFAPAAGPQVLPGPDDPTETEDDDQPPAEDSDLENHAKQNGNGKPKGAPITQIRLNGYKLACYGELPSQEEVKGAQALSEVVRQDGGDRAAVINVGSGVFAAAIAPNLTTYGIDAFAGAGGVARLKAFSNAFMGSTSVRHVPGEPRQLGVTLPNQSLDLIFFDFREDAPITKELLDAWLPHLSHKGVIAGRGYDEATESAKFAVMEFADSLGLQSGPNILDGTTIWAIRGQEIRAAMEKNREPAPAST